MLAYSASTGYCGGMKPINSETGIKLAITSTSMGVPFHISMLNIEVLVSQQLGSVFFQVFLVFF